jgi:hypothetical protein
MSAKHIRLFQQPVYAEIRKVPKSIFLELWNLELLKAVRQSLSDPNDLFRAYFFTTLISIPKIRLSSGGL